MVRKPPGAITDSPCVCICISQATGSRLFFLMNAINARSFATDLLLLVYRREGEVAGN